MKQSNSTRGAKLGESGFELERLFNGLMYELLDQILSPGRQRAATISPRKSFDAGEADTLYFPRFAIENDNAGFRQNGFNFLLLPRMKVMIA